MTIDKLGIQMYDRVSAVLAELIANAYDADAEEVNITLPFGQYLARKTAGEVIDQGFEIVIKDNGCGMTVKDVNDYYLNIGYNRRASRSEQTPKYSRRVMGRKGIGKLAPFGICREVEVVTAGGAPNGCGYVVSNLILNLDEIMSEKPDEYGNVLPYNPSPGIHDGTYADSTGTILILRNFDRKLVPTREELDRQLSARFGLTQANWRVQLKDSAGSNQPIELGKLNVDVMSGTRIVVDKRPVKFEGQSLLVSGWIGYAKNSYKDEVMAGVRIYARGKIIAQTRDFDIKTGFTGEFKMRSYLTGEIHAEWLDDEVDFIRTDRQDIIWNSELGVALREWGREILKELAAKAEKSTKRQAWSLFLKATQLDKRVMKTHPNDKVTRDSILNIAKALIAGAERDAIIDPSYQDRMVSLAFATGPHSGLLATLDKVASTAGSATDIILNLFEEARFVETYSLGQVAQERVHAIEQLRRLISDPQTVEEQLQRLIQAAPWIIYHDWTPLSFNQSLTSTRTSFESWYLANYRREIVTASIKNSNKRPGFVMLNHIGRLEVVEIKRPQHALTDAEFDRAFQYLVSIRKFIASTSTVKANFPEARLTIICDSLSLDELRNNNLEKDPAIHHRRWHELLDSTNRGHEDFLKVVRAMQGELPDLSWDKE